MQFTDSRRTVKRVSRTQRTARKRAQKHVKTTPHTAGVVSKEIFFQGPNAAISRPAQRDVSDVLAKLPCTADYRREHYEGTTAEELSRLTGAHVTTARRWKRKGAPIATDRLLRMALHRELAALHHTWEGWKILSDGSLCNPDGWNFTPQQVTAIPLNTQLVHVMRRDFERALKLATQADWIANRFTDPQENVFVDTAKVARDEQAELARLRQKYEPAPSAAANYMRRARR